MRTKSSTQLRKRKRRRRQRPMWIQYSLNSCESFSVSRFDPSVGSRNFLINWSYYPPIAILIPGFWSVETGLLFLVAAALIGRSVSDIWMIQNATVVESTIIHMNRTKFKSALLKYLTALPAVRDFESVARGTGSSSAAADHCFKW